MKSLIAVLFVLALLSAIPQVEGAKPAKADTPTIALSQVPFGIQVNWTEPDDGGSAITSYQLQKKTNGGAWTTINNSLVLTYTDTDVSVGDQVQYRVRAINDDGNGKYSSATSKFTIPAIVNEKPDIPETKPETGVSPNGPPHMRGGQVFQDMENLRIFTANPNEIVLVFDRGSILDIHIKTVDYTVIVIYKEHVLAHVDTGFCAVKCPDNLQSFRFNVSIPPHLKYDQPEELDPIQNGNWLLMCTRIWNPITDFEPPINPFNLTWNP